MPLARRPTPSHDAAQVLVSFHQNGTPVEVSDRRRLSGGSRPNRPLAFANVNRPPQNRRRVWRACESCRKKKIKCDGSDPCQCCIDNGSECVYAGDGSRRGFVDAQVLDVYGKRLRALEDLVATLVDEQQRLASQLAFQKQETRADIDRTIVSTRQDDIAVPSGFPPNVPLPQSENITVIQDQQFTPITQLVPSENADTIDPELVSSSADESQAAPLELPNTSVGSILQAAHADKNEDRTVPTVYSDEYGMLAADGADGAKYVGLGATVWMMDDCSGIRSRVRQELLQKGHQPQESLLDQPVVCMPSMKAESSPIDRTEHLPPVPLMDTLIDTFFRKIYKLFPIIEAEDFRRQYLMLRCNSGSRSGFLELLYSVLAVSSPHMATDDPVWSRPGCSAYRCLDLGDHFYSLAVAAVGVHEQPLSWMTSFTVQDPSINTVTAFTLLGMHLTQLGKLNEAWRIVGHAVRLGYEMGLHRSPKRMGLPLLDIKRRCQLWWCLYVMDRLLALHLGRPLAIHDADSDVFFPSARPQAPGFVAMTHLCKLIGRIHQVVSTVEQAHKWNDSENDSELQRNINELWQDLQAWKDIKLPAAGVESSPDPSRVTERCVLLSTYCSAVHLLFRTYMPTPHRLSRLPFDQALHESFRVATECIEMTEVFLKHVPVCHYYSLHGQNIVVSIATLLHCRRQTDDERTAADSREYSQRGMNLLARMDATWPMSQRYRPILLEYEALTREMVHRGGSGQCVCDPGCLVSKDKTPLDPWQEFAAQIDLESNLFPSMPDTAWMDELFHLSPTSPPDVVECPTPPLSQPSEHDRPCKRRRTGGNSVCAFAFRQR